MEFKADAERLADAAHPPVFRQQALPLRLGRVTPHQISPPLWYLFLQTHGFLQGLGSDMTAAPPSIT
jgi:hypothetical protein